MKRVFPGLLAWVLFGACLLPFLHRPWLFDDPSFVIAAEAAAHHPLRPHTYSLDFGGSEGPAWGKGHPPATTNPPLSAWLLGLIVHFTGTQEGALHAIMFAVALLALPAVWGIAARFTARSFFAAALFAASPAFFLTSLTLYPHLIYFFFYAWTAFACLRLREEGGWPWGILLGLTLAGAALSLYQWPLLILVACALTFGGSHPKRKVIFIFVAALILFAALWCAWQAWEFHVYGALHFWESYRARQGGSYQWQAAILPLVFLGAGFPILIASWALLEHWNRRSFFLGLLTTAILVGVLASGSGGFRPEQAILLAVFFSGAVVLFICLAIFYRKSGAMDRLLVVWFIIEIAFTEKYLGFASAHVLLPLGLPSVILWVRLWERWDMPARALPALAACSLLLSLALAHADLSTANVGPQVARDLSSLTNSGRIYYWGNSFSGLSYYVRQTGARSFAMGMPLKPEDRVLLPRHLNMHGPPGALFSDGLSVVGVLNYRQKNPLRTFSIPDGAGWYSASWGPLPYTFSTGPVEQIYILQKLKNR